MQWTIGIYVWPLFGRLDQKGKGYISFENVLDLLGADTFGNEDQMLQMWGGEKSMISYDDFVYPTCHIYRRGKGKIVDMTCKPSLFHLVVDELKRVLLDEAKNDTTDASETDANVIMNDDEKMKNTKFDLTMVAGSSLGEEIVASLNEKKKDEANKKLLPYWFWK